MKKRHLLLTVLFSFSTFFSLAASPQKALISCNQTLVTSSSPGALASCRQMEKTLSPEVNLKSTQKKASSKEIHHYDADRMSALPIQNLTWKTRAPAHLYDGECRYDDKGVWDKSESVVRPGRGIPKTHQFKNIDEQLDFLEANIPGIDRAQTKVILEGAHSRGSSAVFGGSRVRGNFRPDSDLDIGFGSLTKAQAGKVIKKGNNMPGLNIEKTLIVPGNSTQSIKTIISPEEFFMRSGFRTDGLKRFDPRRLFRRYKASGYISVLPDGTIKVLKP